MLIAVMLVCSLLLGLNHGNAVQRYEENREHPNFGRFFSGQSQNMADKERTIINKTGDVADKGSAKGCEKEIPEILQKKFSF